MVCSGVTVGVCTNSHRGDCPVPRRMTVNCHDSPPLIEICSRLRDRFQSLASLSREGRDCRRH